MAGQTTTEKCGTSAASEASGVRQLHQARVRECLQRLRPVGNTSDVRDYDRVERLLLLAAPVPMFWLLLFLGPYRIPTAEALRWGVGFALLWPSLVYLRLRN